MSYKSVSKRQNSQHIKTGKNFERSFTKQELLIANDDMKNYSTSLVIRAIETNTTKGYHYVLTKTALLRVCEPMQVRMHNDRALRTLLAGVTWKVIQFVWWSRATPSDPAAHPASNPKSTCPRTQEARCGCSMGCNACTLETTLMPSTVGWVVPQRTKRPAHGLEAEMQRPGESRQHNY